MGDVHGEIDALQALMAHLGYDGRGGHAAGRRLVFVGDLTDRGPDSPAVVELVSDLLAADRAQCVLANHDLNILLGDRLIDVKMTVYEVNTSDTFVPDPIASGRRREES